VAWVGVVRACMCLVWSGMASSRLQQVMGLGICCGTISDFSLDLQGSIRVRVGQAHLYELMG